MSRVPRSPDRSSIAWQSVCGVMVMAGEGDRPVVVPCFFFELRSSVSTHHYFLLWIIINFLFEDIYFTLRMKVLIPRKFGTDVPYF